MIWKRVYEVARNDVVFGECSVPGWCCCKDGVRTQVVFAVSAIAAMATGDAGFDRYSLSNLDIRHFVANFDDSTCWALAIVVSLEIWSPT